MICHGAYGSSNVMQKLNEKKNNRCDELRKTQIAQKPIQ